MRPAAADIALHKLNNFGVGRLGISLEKANAAHDHSRGAEGALESAGIEKGLLHGMRAAVFFQTFDGGYRFTGDSTDGNHAGTLWGSTDQHGTGSALSLSAAILTARQPEFITEDGKERRVGRVLN
jgi:hypothetical protein